MRKNGDIPINGRIQYEALTGMFIYSMSPVYRLEFAKPEINSDFQRRKDFVN